MKISPLHREAPGIVKRMRGVALLALVVCFCMAEGYLKLQQAAKTISDPQVLTISNNVVTLFSTNSSVTEGRVLSRTIQNLGTNPVLWLINSTNVSATNYHGILNAGTTNRDGRGATLDLSKVPYPVSVVTEAASPTVISAVELTQ